MKRRIIIKRTAVLQMMLGSKKGEIRLGPLLKRMSQLRSTASRPPTPEPTRTPNLKNDNNNLKIYVYIYTYKQVHTHTHARTHTCIYINVYIYTIRSRRSRPVRRTLEKRRECMIINLLNKRSDTDLGNTQSAPRGEERATVC